MIAPTKDAVEEWSKELGADTRLSVLSYVMPLKERRRLRAEQAAVFDVVVTTYDVSEGQRLSLLLAYWTCVSDLRIQFQPVVFSLFPIQPEPPLALCSECIRFGWFRADIEGERGSSSCERCGERWSLAHEAHSGGTEKGF